MVSTLPGQGPWGRAAFQIVIIDCKAFGLECKCGRDRGRWEEKSDGRGRAHLVGNAGNASSAVRAEEGGGITAAASRRRRRRPAGGRRRRARTASAGPARPG